jgi:hypothetical protein
MGLDREFQIVSLCGEATANVAKRKPNSGHKKERFKAHHGILFWYRFSVSLD